MQYIQPTPLCRGSRPCREVSGRIRPTYVITVPNTRERPPAKRRAGRCLLSAHLRDDLLLLGAVEVPLLGLAGLADLGDRERSRVVPLHLFWRVGDNISETWLKRSRGEESARRQILAQHQRKYQQYPHSIALRAGARGDMCSAWPPTTRRKHRSWIEHI